MIGFVSVSRIRKLFMDNTGAAIEPSHQIDLSFELHTQQDSMLKHCTNCIKALFQLLYFRFTSLYTTQLSVWKPITTGTFLSFDTRFEYV